MDNKEAMRQQAHEEAERIIESVIKQLEALGDAKAVKIETWGELAAFLQRDQENQEGGEDEKTDSSDDEPPLPRITVPQKIKEILYPIDKANSVIWNMLGVRQGETVPIKVERTGSAKQLNLLYSVEFETPGLQISSALEPYDKRVHIAVSSLYAYGYHTITLGMIYNAMGNDGRPSTSSLERINAALNKMSRAIISLDNSDEAKAYNYPLFRYSSYLLPIERVDSLVNGNVVESAIHLLREPPLQQFARERAQITTIPRKVIQSPLSKTNANLSVEDYLIERISHAKKGKAQRKILYKTIFAKTNMQTKKQRFDAKEKIERLMQHYKKTGFISGFDLAADGVTVEFSPAKNSNHPREKQ